MRKVIASARARRAIGGHEVKAMAMIALLRLGPSAATKASDRMRLGKDRKISVMRIITVSNLPPR
ncbi:hypothetical protein D3C71_2094330 [compost metagenome]